MPNYIPPHQVDSPQASVKNVRPIMDRGEGNWAAALLDWDGSPACALRWSGWARDDGEKPHPGTPQPEAYRPGSSCPRNSSSRFWKRSLPWDPLAHTSTPPRPRK